MFSKSSFRKALSFSIWALIFLFALVLPILVNYALWSVLVSAAPFLFRLAYEHFDNFNLFINRAYLWVTNKEVSWEMKAHFVGETSETELDDLIQTLRQLMPSMNILHKSEMERTVNFPDIGVVIKVFVATVPMENYEVNSELVLAVQRVFVPFHHSTKILNTLINMINHFRQYKVFENEKYSFIAVFTDTNPYLGLFLRRLKVAPSSKLNIDYKESEGANQGRISVTKDKVGLVTHDLQSLQAFSRKYITLSSLNLSEP